MPGVAVDEIVLAAVGLVGDDDDVAPLRKRRVGIALLLWEEDIGYPINTKNSGTRGRSIWTPAGSLLIQDLTSIGLFVPYVVQFLQWWGKL